MEQLSIVKDSYIRYINQVVKNHKISHAYLVEIDSYEQDFSYVMNFVKMILCNISYEELSDCVQPILSQIDLNNYPDIKVIEPDGNFIKKTQLLELQKEYSNRSLIGGKRIYIIKNAEKLNAASANTILKFLEEPDDDIVAFLVTENRYHVLATILSRCQILTLKEEKFASTLDDEDRSLLSVVFSPKIFFLRYHEFIENTIVDKKIASERFFRIENVIVCYLHQEYGMSVEIEKEAISLLKNCSDQKLLYILSILEEELPKLEYNVNYKLWLDSLFAKLIIGG